MKRLLLATLTIAFVSNTAHATPDDTKNFRFSPLTILAGLALVELDLVMGDQWTLGPTAFLANMDFNTTTSAGATQNVKVTGGGIGLRANYYFDGVFKDGWYLSPQITAQNVKAAVTQGTLTGTAEAAGVVIKAIGGYHWFWDSFNLNLGAGISSFSGPEEITVVYNNGTSEKVSTKSFATTGAALDFTIGWTF
jgi:hypothetical protein